jgi:decaprenylphospho-beta-D-ribofuranose 2-oxidase
LGFDPVTGVLVAEAGFTLGQATDLGLPHGWIPPVLPGSRHVTLGGAVAADVHGSNHPEVGSIGRHVAWLEVVGPSAEEPQVLLPAEHPAQFWATVGGLGLTGAITVVALRLRAVDGRAWVVRRRGGDLDEVIEQLEADHARADRRTDVHSVAWLDGTGHPPRLGRGIVHTTRVALRDLDTCPGDLAPGAPLAVAPPDVDDLRPGRAPARGVLNLANRATTATAHRLQWWSAGHGSERAVDLRDCVIPRRPGQVWPAPGGPGGLVRYQFAVPARRSDVLFDVLAMLRRRGLPPALSSLYRLGMTDPGALTFARPGWTLSMELPAREVQLGAALRDLDDIVADAGGRLNLAENGRPGRQALDRMYPELGAWLDVRDRMDPGGVLGAELSSRLGLTSMRRVPSGPGAATGS